MPYKLCMWQGLVQNPFIVFIFRLWIVVSIFEFATTFEFFKKNSMVIAEVNAAADDNDL